MLPKLHPRDLASPTGISCVLCQLDTNAALECPARSTRPTFGSGYKSLAEHLIQFQSLGCVPMDIDINRLDDGDGIEATLMRHQACWHKACRLNFNQTKLDRLNKKVIQEENLTSIQTRSSHSKVNLKDSTCLFCGKAAGSEGLHNASTYDIDRKVRQCALELNDTALLAKLAPADMVALEAKYHTRCLAALYNRARAATSSSSGIYSIAFAELVAYMEDFQTEASIAPVFKLADLAQMYKTRLEQLGVEIDGRVHTSRLKLRLLSVIPNLKATIQGKNVMLSFDDDIGGALQKACDYDCYSEDLLLMRDNISQSSMSMLEQFVVLLYNRTSDLVKVNDARKWLFTQRSRSLESIPPTQAALTQHTKRASYQAYCWNMAMSLVPQLPNPKDWGWWKDDRGWHPLWTTLPEASESCRELIHCGCKKGCTMRCKCVKAALKCTPLCSCSGEC